MRSYLLITQSFGFYHPRVILKCTVTFYNHGTPIRANYQLEVLYDISPKISNCISDYWAFLPYSIHNYTKLSFFFQRVKPFKTCNGFPRTRGSHLDYPSHLACPVSAPTGPHTGPAPQPGWSLYSHLHIIVLMVRNSAWSCPRRKLATPRDIFTYHDGG